MFRAGTLSLAVVASMIRSLGAAVAGLALATCASAAVPLDYLPALKGDYFEMRSDEVGRSFHIYVRLPEGYDSVKEVFPTVYVTDGDSLFPILAAYHLFLHYDEPVPEAVVVGIAYGTFDDKNGNHRATDYSAPPLIDGEFHGGAATYQAFLAKELLPEIERRYRVDPRRRILVGQSRGGQLVLYSAFTEPDLFWGRIASNPSLTPNREFFFKSPAKARRNDLKLYVASGSRDAKGTRAQTLEWMNFWKNRPHPAWELNTVELEGETHAAGITNAYRAGMIWLFDGRQ